MRLMSLFLLALPSVALATSVVARSERELLARADAVAYGQVVRTETVVDARGRIITQAELQVLRGVRGVAAGEFIVVVVPGGQLKSGVVARTVGAPSLTKGDLVLGFFEHRANAFVPMGLSFGLLRVTANQRGEPLVYRETDGATLYQANGTLAPQGMYDVRAMPLERLLARLDQQVLELGTPPGKVTR